MSEDYSENLGKMELKSEYLVIYFGCWGIIGLIISVIIANSVLGLAVTYDPPENAGLHEPGDPIPDNPIVDADTRFTAVSNNTHKNKTDVFVSLDNIEEDRYISVVTVIGDNNITKKYIHKETSDIGYIPESGAPNLNYGENSQILPSEGDIAKVNSMSSNHMFQVYACEGKDDKLEHLINRDFHYGIPTIFDYRDVEGNWDFEEDYRVYNNCAAIDRYTAN